MATLTLTLDPEQDICDGGNHATVHWSVDGSQPRAFHTSKTEIAAPTTAEERDVFFLLLVRLMKIGRTNAQVVQLLANGVEIVV
jgi:hypothetical protein